jgi:hypothetical protein
MTDEHEHEEHEDTIHEAGGAAAGFTGKIYNFNTDAEMKLADALMAVGKYVQGESGCLLGHIKAAVYKEDGTGITLNLIDMDNGVEHHGTLERQDEVKFNFMCAVLDVDEHELTHVMLHAIDDSGLDYAIDPESLKHHHHHHHHDGEEGEEHEHHHHDDDHCECEDDDDDDDDHCECHHHHDDDEEDMSSLLDENGKLKPDHHHGEHDHHHHHDDDDDDHDHEEPKKEEKKEGWFSRTFKRKKKD